MRGKESTAVFIISIDTAVTQAVACIGDGRGVKLAFGLMGSRGRAWIAEDANIRQGGDVLGSGVIVSVLVVAIVLYHSGRLWR